VGEELRFLWRFLRYQLFHKIDVLWILLGQKQGRRREKKAGGSQMWSTGCEQEHNYPRDDLPLRASFRANVRSPDMVPGL
jgi:hypothetical protein